jgi:hypothetical protein
VSTRWEYLHLVWRSTSESRTRKKFDGSPEQYWHNATRWFIFHPGVAEAEEREAWSTDRPDAVSVSQLLNEFGALGWELVSDLVTGNTITTGLRGWLGSSGQPISGSYILKRPVDAGQ